MKTGDDDLRLLEEVRLEDIPELTWQLLGRGVDDAKDPLRTPVLATLNRHGPSQRTVVLRHADRDARIIACHTDRRSGKAGEVLDDGRASWLFYDRQRKLQLRMAGNMSLHADDELADACWERVTARGRACYNTAVGPGRPVRRPPGAPATTDSAAEAQDARGHFAVLACRIVFLDWLYLSARGHRRAQFEWHTGGSSATWLTP